ACPVGGEDLVNQLGVLVRDDDFAGFPFVLAEHVQSGRHDAAVELGMDDGPAAEPAVRPADDEFVWQDRHGRVLGEVLSALAQRSTSDCPSVSLNASVKSTARSNVTRGGP